MIQETSSFVLGALILIVLLPVLYAVARSVTALGDMWSAHLLAPLAPVIGGTVNRNSPCIKGNYQRRDVRVSFSPKQSVGSGDSATWINAFYIEVTDLPGKHDWQIRFRVTGAFGQGLKCLSIEAQDEALAERLDHSGAIAEVEAVSAPTTDYVTVAYESRRKTLTYTDDVSPRWIASHDQFTKQLALTARLSQINERVNSA